MDKSKSGTDSVQSIHCSFWPDVASEWRQRSQRFPWPAPSDIKTIGGFRFPFSTRRSSTFRHQYDGVENIVLCSGADTGLVFQPRSRCNAMPL